MSLEIETWAEVQNRISEPTCQTKGDRDDHLPLLILEMKKDLECIASISKSVICDTEHLKGINIVFGFQGKSEGD